MRVLGIETSTPIVSVAVAADSQVLGEFSLTTKQGHMEHLLPLIDQLLAGLEIAVDDLDGFAVLCGPAPLPLSGWVWLPVKHSPTLSISL